MRAFNLMMLCGPSPLCVCGCRYGLPIDNKAARELQESIEGIKDEIRLKRFSAGKSDALKVCMCVHACMYYVYVRSTARCVGTRNPVCHVGQHATGCITASEEARRRRSARTSPPWRAHGYVHACVCV
jgi:hypothetical protein